MYEVTSTVKATDKVAELLVTYVRDQKEVVDHKYEKFEQIALLRMSD